MLISYIIVAMMLLIIAAGGLAMSKLSTGINSWFGYRTARSGASKEAWEYANRRAGKLMVWIGAVSFAAFVVAAVVLMTLPEARQREIGAPVVVFFCLAPVVAIFAMIARVEGELKCKFSK